jgi:trehalose 6-phosphate phosphatase
MAGGRYDPGVTEPALPALALEGLEAVVFDTDGVLTDTASVHAAAWKRLFDEYLALRTPRGQETFQPFEEADYLRSIDGRPRYELFDVEVDGVEADRLGLPGKPDPALFLEAARRLGVSPGRASVVEDALAGVDAGRGGR